MTELTVNQLSFIKRMGKTEEHARHGFALLARREDSDNYFDELEKAGLFEAANNPAPVPTGEHHVRIPYWSALEYLLRCANISAVRGDMVLANKVLTVVRRVSRYRDTEGNTQDNYHTFREFAEIYGTVPTAAILEQDSDLVATWLSSRFDNDGVASSLNKGAISRLLATRDEGDSLKAWAFYRQCFALQRLTHPAVISHSDQDVITRVGGHWLHELVGDHAWRFGMQVGQEVVEFFVAHVRDLYNDTTRAKFSHFFRPAVEDHSQNAESTAPREAFVDAARDSLLGWIDRDATRAKTYLHSLLHDDISIVRRIAIYALNSKWEAVRSVYRDEEIPALFLADHVHELFGFLRARFEDFSEEQKELTLRAIREIPPENADDSEGESERLLLRQLRWASSLANTTYPPAQQLYAKLKASSRYDVSDHPDFDSYSESFWGPGPSPFQHTELIAFAQDGSIVSKLNSFKDVSDMRGPTKDGLQQALIDAVEANPIVFLQRLSSFRELARPYRIAVLQGFRRLWDRSETEKRMSLWEQAWPSLFTFFEENVAEHLLPSHSAFDVNDGSSWIGPTIADFLRAASSDGRCYPEPLLERAWNILMKLVEEQEELEEPPEHPMDQAINTRRGRALEAIFAHLLRECRIADRDRKTHQEVWANRRLFFDHELDSCTSRNYAFSTLCAAYAQNMNYAGGVWLQENIGRLFSTDYPANFYCAVGGLAYAGTSRRLYVLLRDCAILDHALNQELRGRDMRKSLLERIALGYLWAEDDLTSSRFAILFQASHLEDLTEVASYFARIRGEKLTSEQNARVVAFWTSAVACAFSRPEMPALLMSALSRLTGYLERASGPGEELLTAVAPFAAAEHNAFAFFEQLTRLLIANPEDAEKINRILGIVLEQTPPAYDYKDALRTLLQNLAESGCRASVLAYCERHRDVRGVPELFRELTKG